MASRESAKPPVNQKVPGNVQRCESSKVFLPLIANTADSPTRTSKEIDETGALLPAAKPNIERRIAKDSSHDVARKKTHPTSTRTNIATRRKSGDRSSQRAPHFL